MASEFAPVKKQGKSTVEKPFLKAPTFPHMRGPLNIKAPGKGFVPSAKVKMMPITLASLKA